ncbi:hypothetical protein [Streptomyces sp. enrichment culture]|uniref:hypothetical protein n=1 Tax=Streptomyces sp. enrichment culture TaxID=1795815 RepID=UPI003F568441
MTERGGTVGWIKDRLLRRKPGGAGAGGLCDCCNDPLKRTRAYYLPTREIVLSQAYWESAYSLTKGMIDVLGEQERLWYFGENLRLTASQRNPWSICENCGEYFVFDRDTARDHAVHGSTPAGNGEVDPSGCVLFAAAAWERVFGRWPANVVPHAVVGTCDLCRRNVHSQAPSYTVSRSRMAEFLAAGVVDGGSLPPAGPAEDDWEMCQPCTALLAARCHRAGLGQA